ncbi:MAG TPA: YceI family protein [Gammaproteobacteria bacterium]|nr:YceI family protein [Gammaproteobacteria bacterium]
MMRMALPLLAAILLAGTAGAAATAPGWHSVADGSRIGFVARWQGTPVPGSFEQFSVQARFDPNHPAGGEITVDIASASVHAQSADVTRALRAPAWFDVQHYPQASFRSQKILASGAHSVRVSGTLRIKGQSRQVTFPLNFASKGSRLILDGSLDLRRSDFGIGSGQWAGGKIIAIPVTVDFHVVLDPD